MTKKTTTVSTATPEIPTTPIESTSKKKALTDEKAKKSSKDQKADEKKFASSAKQNDKSEKSEKQKHKELTKQEAKLVLKVEDAQKDVQKAQQKLTKAQFRLDESLTTQLMIEQKLMALRGSEHNGAMQNGNSAGEPHLIVYSEGVIILDEVPQEEAETDLTNEQSADTNDTTEVPEDLASAAQDATAAPVSNEVQDEATPEESSPSSDEELPE